MAGPIVIILALLLLPVLFIMGGAAISALIGEVEYRAGRRRFTDSELLDLPD